jgi:beta-lactamase class A
MELKMTQTKQRTDSVEALVSRTANEVIEEFSSTNLQPNELAFTLIDLSSPSSAQQADFRGNEPIFPASVVKLFYLVAAHRWLADGKITESEELSRALKDMIVESSNDATHYVLDLLTDTTGGPELPADQMAIWIKKRKAVNEHFSHHGYANINVVQKTWGDGPFGRERMSYGKDYENRNKLTTNAAARLLSEIATGKAITPKRSEQMMELLQRDFRKPSEDPDDQATKFLGAVLPADAKLWSKAGWMSTARHDAAYVELANGIRFVLVVFNINHAKEYGIIHSVGRRCLEGLLSIHG